MSDNRILVHEVEPGEFRRFPSGAPVTVTWATETLVARRHDGTSTETERACAPYEAEERIPPGAGAAFWRNHSDDELAQRRLFRAEPFAMPERKQAVGAERFERREDGVVRQVLDLEDVPPPPPPPTAAEKLASAGLSEADLDALVAASQRRLAARRQG